MGFAAGRSRNGAHSYGNIYFSPSYPNQAALGEKKKKKDATCSGLNESSYFGRSQIHPPFVGESCLKKRGKYIDFSESRVSSSKTALSSARLWLRPVAPSMAGLQGGLSWGLLGFGLDMVRTGGRIS